MGSTTMSLLVHTDSTNDHTNPIIWPDRLILTMQWRTVPQLLKLPRSRQLLPAGFFTGRVSIWGFEVQSTPREENLEHMGLYLFCFFAA